MLGLLLPLFMCVKYSDFRTYSNQFSHLANQESTILKVECQQSSSVINIHYSKPNDQIQIIQLHISTNNDYIRIKASSNNDDYRYTHPLLPQTESNFANSNCEYTFKEFKVSVANNIVHVYNNNILTFSIPLSSLIYQDKTVNYEYDNSFASHSEHIQDRSISFQLNHHLKHIYGFPEHTAELDHIQYFQKDPENEHSQYLRLFNLDVFEFELSTNMGIYGSIPFFMGPTISSLDATVGNVIYNAAFLNNPSDTFIHISPTQLQFTSESSVLDLYIFTATKPNLILSQYHALTGIPQLPQLFAIAYHQCRWNYNNQPDVLDINNKFNQYRIPMDVIWLDIEHTNGKRYFTWHPDTFPTPQSMLNTVNESGRKMVTIVDPHIKIDPEYSVYADGLQLDYFVKSRSNTVFEGDCWPGRSVWFDFLNPLVQHHWANLFDYNKYIGSTPTLYTWNDMNEPSVFNSPEITMLKSNLHMLQNKIQIEHRQIHNVFGMYQHKATAMGHVLRDNTSLRPFVLSRAFYSGTQQYGPIWTGDNKATWAHLKSTIPMLLQLQMGGLPFSGADIGGFFGNPDPELLARWYQQGCYQPFMRAHAHIETKRREPWLFEDDILQSVTLSIRMRYQLLPYLYTLFAENTLYSHPIMRPLFLVYPRVLELYQNSENSFHLGESLLVHPVTDAGVNSLEIAFHDTYYAYTSSGSALEGVQVVNATLQTMPGYLRQGRILPTWQRNRRSSALMHGDPLTLIIGLNKNGGAEGTLYMDDYETFEYMDGKYIYRQFEYTGGTLKNRAIVVNKKISQMMGKYAKGQNKENVAVHRENRVERIIVHGIGKVKGVKVKGGDKLHFEQYGDKIIVKDPKVLVKNDWEIIFNK